MIKTKNTEVKFPLGNQAISARTLRKDNLWRILIEVTYHNNYALVKELVGNKNFDEHIL